MTRKNEIYKIYKKSGDTSYEALIREGLLYLTDFIPGYNASTLGRINANYPDTPKGVSDLLTDANIFDASGNISPTSSILPEHYVIGMYKFLVKLNKKCSDIFKHKKTGKTHKVQDIINSVNIKTGSYATLVQKFCTEPKCWELVTEKVGRPLVGGTVSFGTFYNKCKITAKSKTTTTTKSSSAGCNHDEFRGYYLETHGKHAMPDAYNYLYDHHHGVDKQGNTNVTGEMVIQAFFDYRVACGVTARYPCTYPGFVKWYFDNKDYPMYEPDVPGELQPAEAYALLRLLAKDCSAGQYTPTPFSYEEEAPNTPSENIIYRTEEPKETPKETPKQTPKETPKETPKQDLTYTTQQTCEWNQREVFRLLNNLLTGDKPMLTAGSKELKGTFTLAQQEAVLPLLSFIRFNEGLTGERLRSNTEKYIERLIPSRGFLGALGKGVTTLFTKPNRAKIEQVSRLVYRSLSDSANAPTTGFYNKFCHEDRETRDAMNRPKVYVALMDLATGNKFFGSKDQLARDFKTQERLLEETAKARRDIREQRILRNKDTIPVSTASRKSRRMAELIKISSKVK